MDLIETLQKFGRDFHLTSNVFGYTSFNEDYKANGKKINRLLRILHFIYLIKSINNTNRTYPPDTTQTCLYLSKLIMLIHIQQVYTKAITPYFN